MTDIDKTKKWWFERHVHETRNEFFSMKIYATARGTPVADANIKFILNNDTELKKDEHIARVNTLRQFLNLCM